ncbi:MAG TPA: formyltransferase family protein [Fibrobacteria bacterium]|nr:formyltransferase family protein [Fibrobacteria bacterium]
MKTGILCSTAGSAFRGIHDCLLAAGSDHEFTIMTDRACGIEDLARSRSIQCHRMAGTSRDELSAEAASVAMASGCDLLLLFFGRIVSSHLHGALPTFNVHPSLLPAYPGANALRRCLEDGATEFGCSVHRVDDVLDGGPVAVRIRQGMPRNPTLEGLRHASYLQKVMAGLWFLDAYPGGTRDGAILEAEFGTEIPGAPAPLADAWKDFLRKDRSGRVDDA